MENRIESKSNKVPAWTALMRREIVPIDDHISLKFLELRRGNVIMASLLFNSQWGQTVFVSEDTLRTWKLENLPKRG